MGAAALLLPNVGSALAAPTGVAVGIAGDPLGPGYWVLMDNGRVIPYGSARKLGGVNAFSGTATGVATYPTKRGFWRVRGNGRVGAHGAATLTAKARKDRRGKVIGIAARHRGDGFWRVTTTGQVMASGNATHLGGASKSAHRIMATAGHPTAEGYWILNRQGKVFGFGAAKVLGSACGPKAVGLTPHPGGAGYWVVRADGRVFAYGTAAHHGNGRFDTPVVDIAAAPDGAGYWLLGSDGRVRAYGTARSGIISTAPPPDPTLVTVGGIVVASDIGKQLRNLLGTAKDDGINLGGYGYRSYTRQVELRRQNCGPRYYDVYVKSSSECSPMTAIPGRSLHERGLAIDFYRKLSNGGTGGIAGTKAFTWLKDNAKRYGLYNLPSEPWHWSTTGG